MFNPLNQTKTVAYLVIALIIVVVVSIFFVKRTIVDKKGEVVGTETESFFGKTFKK
jgi:predicted ABC-type sugar transport system permease subunit